MASPRRPLRLTSAVVGENIRKLRQEQELSIRELAKKMTELGSPLSGSGVTEIEKGRRSVSVDQLTCFAAIFGTSPIDLFFPDTSPVEYSGHKPMRVSEAMAWLLAAERARDSPTPQGLRDRRL